MALSHIWQRHNAPPDVGKKCRSQSVRRSTRKARSLCPPALRTWDHAAATVSSEFMGPVPRMLRGILHTGYIEHWFLSLILFYSLKFFTRRAPPQKSHPG